MALALRHTLVTSLNALATHKSRSALTILGIVIGITAIIVVTSVGETAEDIIVGELGGLGADTIVVRPGKEPKGPTDIAEVLLSDSLKQRELAALMKKSNVPHLADAAPEVLVTGSVSYGGETFRPVILGFTADFMVKTLKLRVASGVAFDERDIATRAPVAIIGSRVALELFGGEDPVGKNIDIKGRKFRVVGVFEKRGQVVFFDIDELVLVPYTTAQAFLVGTKHFNQIVVRAESPGLVDRTVFDIQQTLRALHDIDDPTKDHFSVQTQQGLVSQVRAIIGVFTIFLSFTVAIALIVGGIGIMNIMLVSVTERTREIGLRKALGATDRDIMRQFLVEAVFLTAIGGIIGVVLGFIISVAVSFFLSRSIGLPWEFHFSLSASLLGIIISSIVGLVFGIYPAYKASRRSPIEALRYE